ncbi:hypothetical protein Acr_27g0001450 [Actinidia rufa]|uniref:Myb/SANT-like domain-containing protein n=1 Tax=Actinidia rufa TaxID=165716 RepID=A0A7J0H5N0_9ERIC|nr:hypothetical protein Acr_27g0001450 [Actinidia rufa]
MDYDNNDYLSLLNALGFGMENDISNPSKKAKPNKGPASKTVCRRSWTRNEEEVLINALKDIVALGMKVENNTFRSGYLQVLEGKIIKALPDTDLRATPHIESKIKKWKKVYNSLFSLLSLSGIGWNGTDKMLDVMNEEAWDDYVKKDVDAKSLRNKSWPFYEDWLIIFGKDRATGVGGMECSNSVTHHPTASSEKRKEKKRARAADTLVEGLTNFADKLCHVMEKADSRMEFIGSRLGYAHDLSAARKSLNAVLLKLPLCPNDRFSAADLIMHDAQRIDFFFSLSDEDKLLYVIRLLS